MPDPLMCVAAMIAALPDCGNASLFSAEQRRLVAFVRHVVSGATPTQTMEEFVAAYGEKATVELVTIIATWSAWAMIINAADPEI